MTERQIDVVELVDQLRRASLTLAVAESLTGGLVMARLTDVVGVSDVLRGGAVVYATDTKASELGVDIQLLDEHGPVDGEVALAMARGVRERWSADLGLATTGVAGPGPQDGHPAGEFYVAVSSPTGERVVRPDLQAIASGWPEASRRLQVRQAAVDAALGLLDSTVRP